MNNDDGEGSYSYNEGVKLNLKWFTVRFFVWQEWLEWIKYGEYKWHNFQFLKIAVEDNYPLHGRFDLHIELALLGLNLMIEIESTKDNSERFAEHERWWNEHVKVVDDGLPPPWPEELADD